MLVFIISKHGKPLMPCKPSKARKLITNNKAKVVSYKPFTIQLLYGSSGYKQSISVGVDLGSKYIGIAIQSENKVIAKGEIELRGDIKSLLETRNSYRRSRRFRKTRYRKPRFLNRTRPIGWLPPSIQSRIDNTFMWIDKFLKLLPNPNLSIEVGKFDVQKMMNPSIEGIEYQEGNAFGFYSIRYFVFARDNYTCQVCKRRNKVFQTHHIIFKSHGGSDRADNLITVCIDCHTHSNHQVGNILYKWMMDEKKVPSYKETPFMNTIRKRVFKKYPNANISYGNITTPIRKELGLDKTHYNDAIVISGIKDNFIDSVGIFKIKQFRKKKRSLHEANPRKGKKVPNTAQKRNSKNTKYQAEFYLNDKVRLFGKIGFISGFAKSGCYVKNILGDYIVMHNKTHKQVSFKHLEFLNHNNNWQFVSQQSI